jgi:hypothetical protein
MLLSILTPSIPRRAQKLATLAEDLRPWLGDDTEWLVIVDERPSGPKRNEMMQVAKGDYVMHLDDDEWLSPKFPSLVLPALALGMDLVAYDALASLNGSPYFRVRTGMDFPNEQPRHLPGGRFSDIRRRPWHWCCWRTELARRAQFPQEHVGNEDAIWLDQMYPLVQTWHKIDEPLFVHRYDSTDSAFPATPPAP